MKLLSRPDGCMLYGKLGVDFFPTCELPYPDMKVGLRLIRARSNFTWLTTTPTVVLDLLIVSFTLVVLLSRMNITKKNGHACIQSRGVQLFGNFGKNVYHLCQTKPVYWRKHFKQFSSLSNCHCNENKLCIHCILYWYIHFGISMSTSDKLEYSKEVSQSLTFMPLTIGAYVFRQWKERTFKLISPHFQLIISNTTIY